MKMMNQKKKIQMMIALSWARREEHINNDSKSSGRRLKNN
jgi:hypothetical protein